MPRAKPHTTPAKRVALYRRKARLGGLLRFEVNLPQPDADLIRQAVGQIRAGGEAAARMRKSIERASEAKGAIARSGKELYALLRTSLGGESIALELPSRTISSPRETGF